MNRMLRMHRTFVAGSVVCGALVLTGGAHLASTQGLQTADAVLGAAIHQDDAEGNLDAAIEGYKQFLAQYGDDRPLAVQALLRLGQAYETLGRPEARDAYERVLRDYADQPEPVAAVRARLAALEVEPTSPSAALHTELLWPEARGVNPGDVSPDGNLATYTDWEDLGNLAIRDFATGESRRLTSTADGGSGENGGNFATWSRISPDGEQVLYTWNRSSPVGETGELRLVPVHGNRTEPRTVWSPADGSSAAVQDWFPSGDRVVAVVNASDHSSIVTVSTVDGQVRQVRSIDWARNPQVRVSPDGRFLAYSRSASREVPEKDIFLVAVDGSSETLIVQHAANDELVAWSLDGQQLLFNSDRSGQPGLWAQRVQDAEPAGEPQLLVANLDVGTGVGLTRDGTLHYPVNVSRRRMKVAELDMKTGRLLRQPVAVTDRFVGGNTEGVFSPDGETLAFVSVRPGGTQRTIVLRSLKTGRERDLPHEFQQVYDFRWRPDGDRLTVRGRDVGPGPYSPLDVNVATGEARRLTDMTGRSLAQPTFTPDGTQILHRNRDTNPERDLIYSYRVADGFVHALPGVFPGERFSLSPDGQWIAQTVRGFEVAELTPASLNATTEIRLHPTMGADVDVLWTTDDREPFGRWTTWTPDGTALLVLKKEPQAGDYMWRLWVVPVDGTDPVATELVYEPSDGGSTPVQVHPDGMRIVYSEGGEFTQFWAVHNLALDESAAPSSP